jgi:GNAT superfamily N-acetyltransferase
MPADQHENPSGVAVASFAIRTVRPDEGDELYRRYRETALLAYAHVFPPARYPFPADAVRETWRSLVGDHDRRHQLFVAELDGELAGAVVAKAGSLEHLFVMPRYWGTGVADALHDSAVAVSRGAGCGACQLEVLEENRRARRFYERHGWVRDERRRIADHPPHPAVIGYTLGL